jgi:hypothetical protein
MRGPFSGVISNLALLIVSFIPIVVHSQDKDTGPQKVQDRIERLLKRFTDPPTPRRDHEAWRGDWKLILAWGYREREAIALAQEDASVLKAILCSREDALPTANAKTDRQRIEDELLILGRLAALNRLTGALEDLMRIAKNPRVPGRVRESFVRTIDSLGAKVEDLVELSQDSDQPVCEEALRCLELRGTDPARTAVDLALKEGKGNGITGLREVQKAWTKLTTHKDQMEFFVKHLLVHMYEWQDGVAIYVPSNYILGRWGRVALRQLNEKDAEATTKALRKDLIHRGEGTRELFLLLALKEIDAALHDFEIDRLKRGGVID